MLRAGQKFLEKIIKKIPVIYRVLDKFLILAG